MKVAYPNSTNDQTSPSDWFIQEKVATELRELSFLEYKGPNDAHGLRSASWKKMYLTQGSPGGEDEEWKDGDVGLVRILTYDW